MNRKTTLVLGLGGAVLAGMFFALKRKAAREEADWRHDQETVDLASEDSFPASDPPSWSATQSAVSAQ